MNLPGGNNPTEIAEDFFQCVVCGAYDSWNDDPQMRNHDICCDCDKDAPLTRSEKAIQMFLSDVNYYLGE
jgi:hypothetical protein